MSTEPQLLEEESLEQTITRISREARAASLELSVSSLKARNRVLERIAELLESETEGLLAANAVDLEEARKEKLSAALVDRLKFTPDRIASMASGVRQVADLPDPLGEVLESVTRPNGLLIQKVRVPIGVIGIIYESRPNVTIDCAVLCLKSGNACILRGGKEAFHTNTFLIDLVKKAFSGSGLSPDCVQFVPTVEREALSYLLKQKDSIHCLIPRGGEGLIKFVTENTLIPVIKHYKGVCNAYVDQHANLEMAEAIVVNAKTQRVGVCNAIENLFIHKACALKFLIQIAKKFQEGCSVPVQIRVDKQAEKILERHNGSANLVGQTAIDYFPAKESDFYEEYLDYIIAIKIVDSLDAAIDAVNKYGSGHSDVIITENKESAERFLAKVDSATVYWNASTRFTDGFEFGLGAEIGISTDRLHARGPMGLKELCSYKYKIFGNGQLRS